MNSNDRNQKRTDATEDDDFGDFEGPEDDAPESVQAMGGPPNWVFPDLLRVQSNHTSHEEPESVSNPTIQMRPHVLNRVNDIRGATGRETGAIPKQRVLDPPDVSLLTGSPQSKLPSTLDLCSSAFNSNSYSRDNSSTVSQSTSSMNRPSNLMSDIGSSHNGTVDSNQMRINQLESDLKQIQTQKQLLQQQLLQKDTQIRELQSQSRQSSLNSIPIQSQDSVIAGITESLDKIRCNIETAMNRLEQRLTSLENRVSEKTLSSINDSMPSDPTSNDLQNGSQNLASLLTNQRKYFEEQKRQNLLLFSSILKNALETVENQLEVNHLDVNHK